jgi:hypothetical protein
MVAAPLLQRPRRALRRHGARRRRELRVFSEHASASSCACSTPLASASCGATLHGPDGVFHGFLPGAGPGWCTAARPRAPTSARAGHRFNPHKLLLDPWAREIVGRFGWRDEHHGYDAGPPRRLRARSTRATTRRMGAEGARGAALASAPRRANAPRVAARERGAVRGARQGLQQVACRACPGAARHLCRPGAPGAIATSSAWA